MYAPLQKILYGPPGAGKSTRVRALARERGIPDSNIVETTFHPDYTYGDFVAKIMPVTVLRRELEKPATSVIRYQTHVGPFIKALALALRTDKEVLLVIDEINRGNGSAIFGDIFQLLDRADNGVSTYGVTLADLVFGALMKECGWSECEDGTWMNGAGLTMRLTEREGMAGDLAKALEFLGVGAPGGARLRLPSNLSVMATMNTSDESVYVMDTAFKRRWEFEFIPWDYGSTAVPNRPQCSADVRLSNGSTLSDWHTFLGKLNRFIARTAPGTRLEDKLVGLWFIKATLTPLIAVLHSLRACADSFDYDNPSTFRNEILSHKAKIAGTDELVVFSDMQVKLDQFLSLCTSFAWGEKAYSASIKWNDLHDTLFPGDTGLSNDELEWLNNRVVGAETWKHRYSPYPIDRGTFTHNRGAFFAKIIDLYIGLAQEMNRIIPEEALQYKLLHFVWDNVFYRDKTKLSSSIDESGEQLRTFDQFLSKKDAFLQAIMKTP